MTKPLTVSKPGSWTKGRLIPRVAPRSSGWTEARDAGSALPLSFASKTDPEADLLRADPHSGLGHGSPAVEGDAPAVLGQSCLPRRERLPRVEPPASLLEWSP